MREPRLAAVVYEAGDGGEADLMLLAAAEALRRQGVRLAGAVQHNGVADDGCRCSMVLEDLASGRRVEISEDRGREAAGCRLNPVALEEVVGLATAALGGGADLLVVNRFGKHEVEGRGFRQAIEAALVGDIAALVAVSRDHLAAWDRFAGGMDVRIAVDLDAVLAWWGTVRRGALAPAAGDAGPD
jgi:nucleoside-triphosphatase THEP1